MIDPKDVTACLITSLDSYPEEVLNPIKQAGFADILIYTKCPNIAGRLTLFEQAKTPFLFTQDDDALSPIRFLLGHADLGCITTVMHPGHIDFYSNRRHCLLNWGGIFPKDCLKPLHQYTEIFGTDPIFLREFDRIFTGLNFPQIRLPYPVVNLPRSADPDRLSLQPNHWESMAEAERRLESLSSIEPYSLHFDKKSQ
jgi:hypothetical protein